MELLFVPVPLFDKYLSVEAYLFRYQLLGQTVPQHTEKISPPLEVLKSVGIEAFSGNTPVLVPVSVEMLEELSKNCSHSPEMITFLLENHITITDSHLSYIAEIRARGYRIAVMQKEGFIKHDQLLHLCNYVVFDQNQLDMKDRHAIVLRYTKEYQHIKVVATGIRDYDDFLNAKCDAIHLFEGPFYRIPTGADGKTLTPIKANLIRLLNLSRDPHFEFRDIANVMRRDPALSYCLMRFINSPYLSIKYKVKSIQHAVTLLGQEEVRKWVTAAVFKSLGVGRPSELTRLSLVRAKFAENLSVYFDLSDVSQSLFLTGLFSVIDVMLDTSMKNALDKVQVSDEIADVLLRQNGPYAPVMQYIIDYENADWAEIIRQNMIYGLNTVDVYNAYIEAAGWYNELLTEKVRYAPAQWQNFQPSTRPDW